MDSFHIDALIGSHTAHSAEVSDHAADIISEASSVSEFDGAADGRKPPPRNLQHLYAEASNLRVPSKMKEYYKFFQIPGIGNIAGGKYLPILFCPLYHPFVVPIQPLLVDVSGPALT